MKLIVQKTGIICSFGLKYSTLHKKCTHLVLLLCFIHIFSVCPLPPGNGLFQKKTPNGKWEGVGVEDMEFPGVLMKSKVDFMGSYLKTGIARGDQEKIM